ncbi:MAG: hypothetical protein DWI28_01160 [Planctomycetota bacterium]|nr:MAG: hypothetical protein DWI28_01160 [Planctomycetota bacterium]
MEHQADGQERVPFEPRNPEGQTPHTTNRKPSRVEGVPKARFGEKSRSFFGKQNSWFGTLGKDS